VQVKGELPSTIGPGEAVIGRFTLQGAKSATFALFNGQLPDGLSLSEGGDLTGTVSPAAPLRTYSFTVTGLSAGGEFALGAFAIEVAAPSPEAKGGCSTSLGGLAPWLLLGWAGFRRRRHPQIFEAP
jgi:uncharacterized protein (TIGR03382 family)